MSAWSKILAPVTVPAAGWGWSWGDSGDATRYATLPAGTYSSVLSMASRLASAMSAVVSGSSITVSQVGIAAVVAKNMTAVHWVSCAADLKSMLGYAGTESITGSGTAAATVTATSSHRRGWYPGVISHGAARGEGLAGDSAWQVADEIGRVVAGTGAMRSIAPSRRRYRREIRFGAIRRSEYEEIHRGVALLEEYGATQRLAWYPDRAEGTVASLGTVLDPASSRTDAAGYYWRVTLLEAPAVEWSSQYPDLCSVTLLLNGEAS